MNLKQERFIHRSACVVGGFAAMYAIFTRANFGSSQTSNLVEIMKGLLGRSYAEAFLHFLGAVIYGSSIFTASYLKRKGAKNIYSLTVLLSAAGFILMSLIPESAPSVVSLYPAFVMAPFMWISFGGMGGYSSSPIFSTNNFRQAIGGLADYCADGDKEHLEKAKFFGGTLLFFHIGAAFGYVCSAALGVKGGFLGVIPCLLLLCALHAPKISEFFGLGKGALHH